jgi:hypothetical protein
MNSGIILSASLLLTTDMISAYKIHSYTPTATMYYIYMFTAVNFYVFSYIYTSN